MKSYVHGGDVYRHPGVLDFSANINPLGTPPGVIRAARDSMERICCYPDASKEELRKQLAGSLKVREDWLIFGNGAAELIFALTGAVKPGHALVFAPSFAEYEQALTASDCRIHRFFLEEEKGFVPGEALYQEIVRMADTLDLVFLCNPNNPTGVLMEPALLRKIADFCQEAGILLAVDECFLDFVRQPREHTLKELLKDHHRLFLLRAFTKTYAMAGLRLGYGICSDPGLLLQMEMRLQPWNVSIPAQEAGVAALGERAYVERARRLVFEESDFLREQLEQLGYRVYASQANYLFFKGEEWLGQALLTENVMIRDCSNYPGLTGGYWRIAVKTHKENQRLLSAVRKVREAWQKR